VFGGWGCGASTDHLNKLCAYLQCALYDLVRWEPDSPELQEYVA
jgi:putative transcriptional regulator